MRVVVVGAGIVGICTAIELIRQGHQVTVMDAAARPASQASRANAGLLSPGHCFSWAEPGIVSALACAYIKGQDRPRIGAPYSVALFKWLRAFVTQSTPENWKRNSRYALQLAQLSRKIHFSTQDIALASYAGARDGLLYLYKQGEAPSAAELELLEEADEVFQILDRTALRGLEPALSRSECDRFETGMYCPMDAYGDARLYATEAARQAELRGVVFKWNTHVEKLLVRGAQFTGVVAAGESESFDACVVAAGIDAKTLLRPLGYDLMIHPVSGYSLSYQGIRGSRPHHGGVSLSDKIAWSPFGEDRMRFTGFADVGYPNATLERRRFSALESFAQNLCPDIRGLQGERWVGQRPMTPDGLPYLGAGMHVGLFLNCGHGAMGWTMAAATARLTAEVISGCNPTIPLAPFRYDRDFC